MARTFTLLQLRTRVRQRTEMESSTFITDAELNSYISASYADLFDRLVKAQPEVFLREQTLTATGSANTFSVASNYRTTVSVAYNDSNGLRTKLRRLNVQERDAQDHSTTGTNIGECYTLKADPTLDYVLLVQILPTPRSGTTYTHTYLIAPEDLTSDAQIIDGVSGFEEFIVVDSAIKCFIKEESTAQAQALMAERNRLVERIESSNERLLEPGKIHNARSRIFDADIRYLRGL